ncbi:transposase protein domain-containing protein [Phthorimaea operculella]|nr:transposase protein domain-containing protein [Phthorimaea operculella]
MAGLTKLKFTIDQQRLLRPIENIMDRRTSSQVPGTLYDVDMDEQHRYLRSIENITSEESSSKELASVTQLAESTTVTEAITKQSIYCRVSTEPKGIQISEKIFILPSPQTLLRVLSMANIRPGINKNTMAQIKKATEKMTVEDRLCIVLFDEMSLKPNVTYNDRKDRVTGFVTNGEDTKPEFADHAQVFMVRGLMKNYKQPVAYTFSQAATKGAELAMQLKTVITDLQAAGLIVVATVCDQGTNNTQCIKLLLQETRGYLLRKGEEPKHNIILINDQEIIPLYDPPHLIKCIRNNLITKHLQYKDNTSNQVKTAKWAHIEMFHQENPGYKGIRLVPKLTDAHCIPSKIPKMKVKYASQVFSQTVGSTMGYLADKGILPSECKETADVLLFFDNLLIL